MPEYGTAIVMLVTLAGWEVVKKLIGRYWDKTVEADYVTVETCQECREKCRKEREKEDAETRKLLKAVGFEVKRLRLTIVKHMVHSKAPPEAIEEALGGENDQT